MDIATADEAQLERYERELNERKRQLKITRLGKAVDETERQIVVLIEEVLPVKHEIAALLENGEAARAAEQNIAAFNVSHLHPCPHAR